MIPMKLSGLPKIFNPNPVAIPEVMGGIILVASAEYQMYTLKHLIAITTDPVQLATFKAELAAVEAGMGIMPGPYDSITKKAEMFDFKKEAAKKGVIFRNGFWEVVR